MIHLALMLYAQSVGLGGGCGGSCGGGMQSLPATGDTRTITEPVFPAVCSQVSATKYIVQTTAFNIDPWNSTCGSTGGAPGILGCTGGTDDEPSSTTPSFTSSETLDNTAVQNALNACASGKAVEIVQGASGQRAIVMAPFTLPTGVSLILDAGIHLYGSRNLSDYPGTSCGQLTNGTSACTHLITSSSTTGSGIYGYGIINGRSWDAYTTSSTNSFYACRIQAYCNARGGAFHGSPACTPNASGTNCFGPNAVQLLGTTNFTMYKTTLRDSGNFLVNWSGGNGFTAWDTKLFAPFEVSNTDGWDPEGSTNGTFTKGFISNGDNQTAVKATSAGTSNITVSNTQTGAGTATAIGSATQFGITNVLFNNIQQNGNLNNDQAAGIQIGSSGANGGLVSNVTFQNYCMKNENNSIRLYTNFGGGSGPNTPVYQEITLRNIAVLPSTAPYTTGNSGFFTFQGLSGNPIMVQLDNLTIAGVNQGVTSQNGVTKDQYSNVFAGPSAAVPSSVQTQFTAGISNAVYGTPSGGTPYCTSSSWQPLIGELNLKTPALNNTQSYNNTGGTSYTLQAVLFPATDISTKESPALTAPVTFLDNGVSVGSVSLIDDGSYAPLTISSPPAGVHTYTVKYPGDSNYSSYTFGSVTATNPSTPGVPTQFASLPTTSTDYTCVGVVPCSTWPMPAMPSAGGSLTDPVYGTTTYRIPATTGTSSNQMPTYSRVQAWNSSNTKMMTTVLPTAGGVTTALYDATTTPPTFINIITPSDGYAIDGADNDALWAYTDPNRIYYNLGTNTSHGLELRYIDISGCTNVSCSPTPVIVHTFACTTDSTSSLGPGVPGNKIETGSGAQGSMFDSTDTYFIFTCDKVDVNGRHEIDLVSYNRNTNTVTTQEKWYNLCVGATPSGCKTYTVIGSDTNLTRLSMHPSGSYESVIWQAGARDATWVRGEGVESFDRTFTYQGVISPFDGHQDMGYDINGVPVWVGVSSFRNDTLDDRAISITNLTTLSPTAQTYRRILLPCSYNRTGPGCNVGTDLTAKSGASHISMTGTIGTGAVGGLAGYGLFSTMILAGQYRPQLPDWPTGTTLGTAIGSAGTFTVTPASMADIGVGVVSTVGTGSGMESVTWTSVTGTTATATFTKTHASTDGVRCLSCGDTGFAALENLVVKIDSTATDGSNAIYYRAGRTHAIRDNWYNSEPHTTVNRDFTQMLFGSSWDVDCNANTCVNAYWMKLP